MLSFVKESFSDKQFKIIKKLFSNNLRFINPPKEAIALPSFSSQSFHKNINKEI